MDFDDMVNDNDNEYLRSLTLCIRLLQKVQDIFLTNWSMSAFQKVLFWKRIFFSAWVGGL